MFAAFESRVTKPRFIPYMPARSLARSFAGTRLRERERERARERDIAYPVLRARRRFRASRNRSRERGIEREARRTLYRTRTRRRSGKGARAARQESESRLMSRCSIYLLNYICMCMPGNYGDYCAGISRAAPRSADLPIVIAATSFADRTGVAKETLAVCSHHRQITRDSRIL